MCSSLALGLLLPALGCGSNDPVGDPVSTCATPVGAGTQQGSDVSADTTWTAAGSPHLVTTGLSIAQGATLTLEPCAEVRIQAGHGITVNGALKAHGTPTNPITIAAENPAAPWTYIRTTVGAPIDLAYVTIQDGGDPSDPNGLGLIDIRGNGKQPVDEVLSVDHVTLVGSGQYGVVLRAGGTFTPTSTALSISGATLGPIRSSVALAGNIPDGTYTGNSVDEILLLSEDPIAQDTTYHARGVPYRLGDTKGNGNDLRVGAAGSATTAPQHAVLTLEAGVTVRVSPGGRLLMQSSGDSTAPAIGALVAKGTAAAPVVFTSAAAAPTAGDWVGLYFAGVPDPANQLTQMKVEFAGGPSQARSFHCDLSGGLNEAEDAAILILGLPGASFVTSSTISASAGYGIDRGWYGSTIDFAAGNTFTQIAKCNQSYPRDVNGSCPSTVTCN